MRNTWQLAPLALSLSVAAIAPSAGAQGLISTPSLNDLLNLEITVSSGDENRLTTRQSPGVITVLTRRVIDAIGASNLYELLRHVAGYEFGVNESNVESFIVRGSYGGEGQVLINYNGVPINETSYGSTVFAGHFLLDHIDRIEIIRGPGSALYGGVSELGVINIVSKKLRGQAQVSLATNQTSEDTGYRQASFGAGYGGENEGDFAINVFGGFSQRDKTDSGYYGFDGTFFEDPTEFFENENDFLQINASLAGFDLKVLYAEQSQNFPLAYYDLGDDDGTYRYNKELPGTVTYSSLITQLDYRYELFEYTTIKSSLFIGKYDSGQFLGEFVDTYEEWYWDIPSDRINFEVALNERPLNNDDISIDVGYGFTRDSSDYNASQIYTLSEWYLIPRFADIYAACADECETITDEFDTHYLFAQGLVRFDEHTITAGLRAEDHSEFGIVTVPRLGLTYVDGPFHYKLLASRAYKSPPVVTLGITPDIKPEEAQVLELEIGHLIGDKSLVRLNLFTNTLENVITYDDTAGQFSNEGDVKTRGAELEFRYQDTLGFAALSLSHYVLVESDITSYQAFDYDADLDELTGLDNLLGAAEVKVAAYGEYRITDQISINPSLIYLGERYTIGQILGETPEASFGYYTKLDPDVIANLYVRYRNLGVPGLNASLGVYNITDGDNITPTGFVADEIPTTNGIGRRIDLKLDYTL
jgi:outer membrane cobalamin receptor